MLQRIIAGIIVFLCLGSLAMCSEKKGQMMISIQQAIDRAGTKAQQLGYHPSAMVVSANSDNTKWQQFAGRINLSKHLPSLAERIKGKTYFAIYFGPKNIDQMGGDLWVFVDRHTGEVLDVWQGK